MEGKKVLDDEVQSYTKRGWSLYFENKYNEAIPAFDKALQLNPSDQSALRGKGWSCIQKGDYASAIPLLTRAVEVIDPAERDQYGEALRGLAGAYFHRGEHQRAIQFFNRTLEFTDPQAGQVLSEIYSLLGWANIRLGQYDEATRAFRSALAHAETGDKELSKNITAGLNQAAIGKGWSYVQKGDYESAIPLLTRAVEVIDPAERDQYGEALRGLAWAYFHRGEHQRAIQFFNRTLEFTDPKAAHVLREIYSLLGWADIRLGQYDEASRAFRSALAHAETGDKELSKNITAGLNLAIIGKKEGKLDDMYLSTWPTQVNSNTALMELGLPEIIEIEPTFSCNLRCIQCHVSYQKLGKDLIRPDFVRQLKGLEGKWVVIGATFEPFMHPDIDDILLELSALGMKIEVLTNGTLLTEELTDRLADCSFSNVIVSFDGIRKETYESIRKNANYEKTLERILYFKDTIRSKDTLFAINNTLMRRTIDEALGAVEFWEGRGFDHMGMIVMVVRVMNEVLGNENLEPMMGYVYKKLYEVARAVIERNYRITVSSSIFNKPFELKARCPRNFVDSCVKSDNPAARTPFNPRTFFVNGDFTGMHVPCRAPFKAVRIMWNGDVEICYKFVIGNIYKDNLIDIWYGDLAEKYREMILSTPEICYGCEYYKFCIKGGEVDYQIEDNFYNEKVRQYYSKPTLIESFRGYNIVGWRKDYYGVPQGKESLNLLLEGVTTIKNTFEDEAVDSLKEKIKTHAYYEQPTLIGNFLRYNIVGWGDRYYGLPESLGQVNLAKIDSKIKDNIFVDESYDSLKEKIRTHAYYGRPTLLESFRGYNIVSWRKDYYGVPQNKESCDPILEGITKIKGTLIDRSIDSLREKIQTHAYYEQPTLIESLRAYNIVGLRDRYYGVPKCFGHINLEEDTSKIEGIIVDKSYDSLKEKIAAYLDGYGAERIFILMMWIKNPWFFCKKIETKLKRTKLH